MSAAAPKQAVLIGAGHAHLHLIREAARFRKEGHALVVVAPEPFWYSGLATGMLGGIYPPELDRIDVAALAARGGAHFIADRMIGLDRARGEVVLQTHSPVPYDALSLNLGSEAPPIAGSDRGDVYQVKPISRLRDLRADLEARFAAGAPTRVVVAGGGATAAELAGNLARLAAGAAPVEITLLAGGATPLKQLPRGAVEAVLANLRRRGVRLRTESRVVRLEADRAALESGEAVGFDILLNATGLRPAAVLARLGLPLDETGAMIVDAHLRSPADPRIHGGGDCVAVEGHALPRIGVYAIRQAPVLLHNLLASLDGAEPRRFVPQRRYLWIMNLGDGTGLAMRGGLWWRGRSAFRLKDWLDRRFLASYRTDEPAGT